MIEELVNRTNSRIRKTLENLSQGIHDSDRYPHYKEIDHLDMYAFIGLFYMRGLYNLNTYKRSILFSEKQGLPVSGATMSLLRFKFILAHLCFDDEETCPKRWQNDRFTAFRDFFRFVMTDFPECLFLRLPDKLMKHCTQ